MKKSLTYVAAAALVATATVGVFAQHQHSPAPAATTGEQKLGAGVTAEKATPIADLYKTPDAFVGKTIRLDGVVTAVCEAMGCWMALAAEGKPDEVVRFKVDHGVGITFPIAAKGKKASAEGTFERIGADDAEAKEAAAEHGGHGKAAEFGAKYQIKATGAVIR